MTGWRRWTSGTSTTTLRKFVFVRRRGFVLALSCAKTKESSVRLTHLRSHSSLLPSFSLSLSLSLPLAESALRCVGMEIGGR